MRTVITLDMVPIIISHRSEKCRKNPEIPHAKPKRKTINTDSVRPAILTTLDAIFSIKREKEELDFIPYQRQLACPIIIRTATLGWPSINTLRADQTLFHAFRRISVVFRIGSFVFLRIRI